MDHIVCTVLELLYSYSFMHGADKLVSQSAKEWLQFAIAIANLISGQYLFLLGDNRRIVAR